MQRPELGNATELVPLTIFKPSKASSYKDGNRPLYAIDEALHTWWQPAADDAEPTLSVALQGRYVASAVRIMWKDIGLNFKAGVNPGEPRGEPLRPAGKFARAPKLRFQSLPFQGRHGDVRFVPVFYQTRQLIARLTEGFHSSGLRLKSQEVS